MTFMAKPLGRQNPGSAVLRFALGGASEVDAAALAFPIAEPGRLRALRPADFLFDDRRINGHPL